MGEIIFKNLDDCIGRITRYENCLRNSDMRDVDHSHYSFIMSKVDKGKGFKAASTQEVFIYSHLDGHDNHSLKVHFDGSKEISENFTFEQLLEKLISGKIVSLERENRGSHTPATVSDISKNLRRTPVILMTASSSLNFYLKDGNPVNVYSHGNFLEGDLYVRLLEKDPQFAPIFGISETLAFKRCGDKPEVKYEFNDMPADFDFREFSDLIYLGYVLMNDVDFVERLKQTYEKSGIIKKDLITEYFHGGPLDDVKSGLLNDAAEDGKVICGSKLHKLLSDLEIGGKISRVKERYNGLLRNPAHTGFYSQFRERVKEIETKNNFASALKTWGYKEQHPLTD